MAATTSTVPSNVEKHCPKKGCTETTRFVSVFDERDPVEYRIVGPFDWSCTCYIDAGTLRMVGPLRPLERPQSNLHDHIVRRQERDNLFQVQVVRGHSSH